MCGFVKLEDGYWKRQRSLRRKLQLFCHEDLRLTSFREMIDQSGKKTVGIPVLPLSKQAQKYLEGWRQQETRGFRHSR